MFVCYIEQSNKRTMKQFFKKTWNFIKALPGYTVKYGIGIVCFPFILVVDLVNWIDGKLRELYNFIVKNTTRGSVDRKFLLAGFVTSHGKKNCHLKYPQVIVWWIFILFVTFKAVYWFCVAWMFMVDFINYVYWGI